MGLVVCCAPKAKVLPTGAGAESNPTNFTPGPSVVPGVPVSQSEGKWLACRIVLLYARRKCLERKTVAGLLPHTIRARLEYWEA